MYNSIQRFTDQDGRVLGQNMTCFGSRGAEADNQIRHDVECFGSREAEADDQIRHDVENDCLLC